MASFNRRLSGGKGETRLQNVAPWTSSAVKSLRHPGTGFQWLLAPRDDRVASSPDDRGRGSEAMQQIRVQEGGLGIERPVIAVERRVDRFVAQ